MGILSFLKRKTQRCPKGSALTNLNKAVIDASHFCAEFMKPEIEQNTKEDIERHERFMHVYFEFFYFFMHHVNRILFGLANQDVMSRYLKMGWLFCGAAVESIIADWPQELKLNIYHEVLDKLDEAEGNYSSSKSLIWDKDKPLDGITGDSLLSKLTRTIIMQCGYEMIDYQGVKVASNLADNMILQIKVSELFINVTKNINFDSLVKSLVKEAN